MMVRCTLSTISFFSIVFLFFKVTHCGALSVVNFNDNNYKKSAVHFSTKKKEMVERKPGLVPIDVFI